MCRTPWKTNTLEVSIQQVSHCVSLVKCVLTFVPGWKHKEDADSEGHEGKFYVWTKDEIYSILPNEVSKPFRDKKTRKGERENTKNKHAYLSERERNCFLLHTGSSHVLPGIWHNRQRQLRARCQQPKLTLAKGNQFVSLSAPLVAVFFFNC